MDLALAEVPLEKTYAPSHPELSTDRCAYVCQWISHAFHCQHFQHAVEWEQLGLLDYPTIVKNPMDLNTLCEYTNTDSFHFPTFLQMSRLIWNNACIYNPTGHPIHMMALVLGNLFEQKLVEEQQHPHDDEPYKLHSVFMPLVMYFASETTFELFCDPIDIEKYAYYPSFVTIPMCFDDIIQQLQKETYNNRYQILSDMLRICHNCVAFNGTNDSFCKLAADLETQCNQLFTTRFADVDMSYDILPEMRLQMHDRIVALDSKKRLDVSEYIHQLCPEALQKTSQTSCIIIDILNLKQFYKVDAMVRRLSLLK